MQPTRFTVAHGLPGARFWMTVAVYDTAAELQAAAQRLRPEPEPRPRTTSGSCACVTSTYGPTS
jgi:hypothetical protein